MDQQPSAPQYTARIRGVPSTGAGGRGTHGPGSEADRQDLQRWQRPISHISQPQGQLGAGGDGGLPPPPIGHGRQTWQRPNTDAAQPHEQDAGLFFVRLVL